MLIQIGKEEKGRNNENETRKGTGKGKGKGTVKELYKVKKGKK